MAITMNTDTPPKKHPGPFRADGRRVLSDANLSGDGQDLIADFIWHEELAEEIATLLNYLRGECDAAAVPVYRHVDGHYHPDWAHFNWCATHNRPLAVCERVMKK